MSRYSRFPASLPILGLFTTLALGQTQFSELGRQRLPRVSDHTRAMAMGDVDRDGDLDLVLGNSLENRLYQNDGKGSFSDASASRLPRDSDSTQAVALGDVDGDGDLDLVAGNDGWGKGEQNRLYLNDGKGSFSDATASRLPKDSDVALAVALGDVDGDRDLDLVAVNLAGQNRLYLNDGKGTLSDASVPRMPKDLDWTKAVALGDVDQDGDLDLVTGNDAILGGQQNRLYLNDGRGSFRDATATGLPKHSDATQAVVLGDVDLDGDLDLMTGNDWSLWQNRLYLNDGKGRFLDASASRMPDDEDLTWALAPGDVDGDGDLDLAIGNYGGQNRLYLNLHRQLDTPLPAILGKPYQLDFYARPGYAKSIQFAAPFSSLAPAVPPIQVPPFGSFGLSLAGLIPWPVVSLPAPAGTLSIRTTVPPIAALQGLTLHWQALTVHRVIPLGAHFTNVVADRIIK